MAIYDRPVASLIRDMAKELAPVPGQTFSRQQAIAWFAERYPKIKRATVAAHLARFSTNAPSRIYYSVRPDENLFYQVDSSTFRLYDAANDPSPIDSKSTDSAVSEPEAPEPDGPSEFAYERDLREFLAKNMSVLEPGLRLYEDEGVTGVEFPAGGRFIDILAVDAQKNFVVIELKVSRGYDRVVGQLLRYTGWIEQNLAEVGQKVRGVIVAREITGDLKLACSSLPTVSLYEYQLSVSLRKVK